VAKKKHDILFSLPFSLFFPSLASPLFSLRKKEKKGGGGGREREKEGDRRERRRKKKKEKSTGERK